MSEGIQRETVTMRFRAAGTTIEATAEVPREPISLTNLLPFLQQVEEAVVESACAEVAKEGKTISCRAGCGACCRQLVPVSLAEAENLANLVAALPEAERTRVEARFTAALAAFERAGDADELRALNTVRDAERAHAFGMRYFLAGVACPFLVDESCSIHPSRPLACREYLVTTPADHCAAPEDHPIDRVGVPRDLSRAMYRMGDGQDDSIRWVPLVRILEWTRSRPPLPTAPAKHVLERLVREIAAAVPADGRP